MANVAAEDRGKTRTKVTQAASILFYEQGAGNTSLADISEASGVSLGNIYYYFKTKDDLMDAVIARRASELESALAKAEDEPAPLDRLVTLLEASRAERKTLSRHGCPYAALVRDADKLESEHDAAQLLRSWLDYAEEQFTAMGLDTPAALAAEFVSRIQGAYLLANAFKSPEFLDAQLKGLKAWLKTLT